MSGRGISEHPVTTAAAAGAARRPAWWTPSIAIMLLLAGALRLSIAFGLPALSRDGVTFCWYARALGEHGAAYLRDPAAQQHPLFPILILGVERAVAAGGLPAAPLTWQLAGQIVALIAGLSVVALSGAVAWRLTRRLNLPVDPQFTALLAMGFMALLDTNVWLSADVMSDQVQLAFYLGAVFCLLDLSSWRAAWGCGLLSALAFLTRPEGALPLVGGLNLLLLMAITRRATLQELLPRALVLVLAFGAVAAPYWMATGRFTSKKDPRDLFDRGALNSPTAAPLPADQPPPPSLAKLDVRQYAWYALAPVALERTLRGGRYIIPLLAWLPLINLRRQLLGPVLSGYTVCLVGHFALTVLLLSRWGYLHPRHSLVVIALLAPFAALFLGRLLLLLQSRSRVLAGLLLVAVFAPLAAYAVRTPNDADRFVRATARWMTAQEPAARGQRLVGGASLMRVAFYADLRWEPWWEDQADYGNLAGLLRAGPGYFAIELEGSRGHEQREIAGNRALLERLLADSAIAVRLTRLHVEPAVDGREIHLFRIAGAP